MHQNERRRYNDRLADFASRGAVGEGSKDLVTVLAELVEKVRTDPNAFTHPESAEEAITLYVLAQQTPLEAERAVLEMEQVAV